jgi:hypothetical protein
MSIHEAVAIVVPLCLDLAARHESGARLYVHPSCIAPGADGLARLDPARMAPPTHPRDRVCVPPELLASGEPGDSTASVFSVGAILYEVLTGQPIGPGMRRPREIQPDIPEALEILIGKAIIGDRAHRPGDLAALASAMHHVAPEASAPPPEVAANRLDASAELEVDVRFSMLPAHEREPDLAPAQIPQASPVPAVEMAQIDPTDPFGAVIQRPNPDTMSTSRRLDDPVMKLAALKARLESDPTPRYVVNKNRMDHGPFTAVELLQQIASNQFTAKHTLRDEITGQNSLISEWEDFAPFAEQAALKRQVVAEQKAVVRAVRAEKKGGIAKLVIGLTVVGALAAGAGVWFFTKRGTRSEDIEVAIDRSGGLELSGSIQGHKRTTGPKGGGGGAGGPGFSGGESFENVLNNNNQTIVMGQSQTPDLTNAQLAAPLRAVGFISACGAPDDMKLTVRVAVKMGKAVGVTVSTNPPSPGVAACVDRHVRGLVWPVSEKADFVTVNY